jgi:hypothetical protein
MTTPSDNQVFESFVPVYDVVPEQWEQARPFLVEILKKISNAVNVREIGFYLDEELLSGKAFIPTTNTLLPSGTSQQFRQVLRKVVDFGALPNAGTKSVPHGITVTNNFTLVSLTAGATDPTGLSALPLPYANPAALNLSISLAMDATNINIVTGVNRSNYTRCYVIIEYLQEL